MRVAVAVVAVLGCGRAAAPAAKPAPAPAPVAELECGVYSYQLLIVGAHHEYDGEPMKTAYDAAITAAQADYDAATKASEAHHPREAAHQFLACARRFLAVPAGDHFEETAIYDAQVCYYDAIYAYANAGALGAEGRAALAQAAADDPRSAAYIRKELADAPDDCAPSDVN
jgi:hypothetical protein